MDNQPKNSYPRIFRVWDKRTLAHGAVSLVLAVGVTLSVSAAQGAFSPSVQPPIASVSGSHTASLGGK